MQGMLLAGSKLQPVCRPPALPRPASPASATAAGFGQLHPRSQGITTLGTIYSSSLFPNRVPKGQVRAGGWVGGASCACRGQGTPGQAGTGAAASRACLAVHQHAAAPALPWVWLQVLLLNYFGGAQNRKVAEMSEEELVAQVRCMRTACCAACPLDCMA